MTQLTRKLQLENMASLPYDSSLQLPQPTQYEAIYDTHSHSLCSVLPQLLGSTSLHLISFGVKEQFITWKERLLWYCY